MNSSVRESNIDKNTGETTMEVPVQDVNVNRVEVEVEEPASCCQSCTRPFMTSNYPLRPDAPCYKRFFHNFLCPPHSRVGAILFVILITISGWGTLVSMTGNEALPGGNLFSIFFLFICCWCGGYVIQLIKLPPLLGMLLVGGALGNVPHINFAKDIEPAWSSGCRMIALCVILIRAGLGLDPNALKRLSCVVIRLAFSPCLVEATVDGVAAHLILGFPWPWAFMLGFVIAAVSPAVVVPCLLSLSDRGYGLDKGVPTLVIAASSIDDVLAITGFGVMLGIAFSSGNIAWTLLKGPLEAVVGIAFGIVTGIVLWYIPQQSSKNLVLFRSTLLMAIGLLAVFGSKKLEWSGAGPLAALTVAFVAAFRWRQADKEGERNPVEDVEGVLWMIFQPLLFGLIGAEVDVASLNPTNIARGVAVLGCGIAFRTTVAFLAVFKTNLNMKERLFVAISWLPKATVQAAIGAVAYDTVMELYPHDEEKVRLGKSVLELAVLSILLTAPIGAIGIGLAGTAFLKRTVQGTDANENKGLMGRQGDNEADEEDVELANSEIL